jgi:hypothetical protein
MKMKLIKHGLTMLAGALALIPATLLAQDATAGATNAPEANLATQPPNLAAPEEDQWRVGVIVPLWAPQINGNVTIRGQQRNVDVSFSQLKDHLDASFALGLDVGKGKFDVYGDIGYMKFSVGGGDASSDLKFIIADGGVSYLLVNTGEEHPFILAGTAGIRYWYADLSARVTVPILGEFNSGNIYRIADPVIGLRASQYLTRKLHLDVSGDGGGFDINNDTDWTWSASGVVTYDFAKWFSLSAGYKALALDESKGSGDSKKGIDLIFNGVLVLAQFKF